MKLYTKEDFLKAAEFCEVSMIDAKYIIERIDEVTDPIKIPSDQESTSIALQISNAHKTKLTSQQEAFFVAGFQTFSIWMRDKIQGGNK